MDYQIYAQKKSIVHKIDTFKTLQYLISSLAIFRENEYSNNLQNNLVNNDFDNFECIFIFYFRYGFVNGLNTHRASV